MTGRPREWDYEEVARTWHLAVDRGESPVEAVAALKGRSLEAAQYAITRARKAGLVPPSGRSPRRTSRSPITPTLPRRVSKGACPTCGTLLVPSFAPRERHTVDPSLPPVQAADRRAGAEGAAGRAARRVLMCDDCEFTCEIDRPRLIFRHCLEVHQRRPTLDERRPARISPRPDVSTLTAARLR